MSFNDVKLKEVQAELVGHDPRLVSPLAHECPWLRSLLARLAAAEACIVHNTEQCEYEHSGCYECGLVKAWRKTAGKTYASETL